MAIRRWEPFGEISNLRQMMDRMMEETFMRPSMLFGGFETGVPIDMYETENELVIQGSLPGVKPEDVDITVTGDTITIKGEMKAEEEVKRENYLRQERRYGAFSRSITLPGAYEAEKAEAHFEHGILTLRVPKSEQAKPKQIKVQAGTK